MTVEVVGGAADGRLVPFQGPRYRVPVKRRPSYVVMSSPDVALPPAPSPYGVEEYEFDYDEGCYLLVDDLGGGEVCGP